MQPATTLVARLVVTLLVVVAVAGQVAHLDALSGATLGLSDALTRNARPSFLTLVAADAVVSALSGIVALTFVFRGDPERGSRALGIALAAWAYLLAYSGVIVLLRPDPGALRVLFDGHFPVVETLGLAGLIRFTAVYPRRLGRDDLTAPDELPIGLRTLQLVRMRLLTDTGPWIGGGVVLIVLFGVNAAMGGAIADVGLHPVMDLVRFFAVAVVVFNLRRSWVMADAAGRDRISWILVGLALLIGAIVLLVAGNILLAATGWAEPTVAWRPILLDIGLTGILWGAAMAVFYGGALSAGATVRRVASITALATLVLLLATGLEVLLSTAFVSRVSLPPGLGTAVSVVAAIATYGHTLPFIESVLDHFPGVGEEATPAA